MRFIQGLIVGAVLMLGAAYLHDIGMLRSAEGKPPPPFVNWDTLIGAIGRW
jgi:hypothetical protein